MTTTEIKNLLNAGKYSELRKRFELIDSQDNTIHKWQKIWGLPAEPHGYNLAHKLRSSIMSFICNYYGVQHLNGNKFEAIALNLDKPSILKNCEVVEDIAPELTAVYKKISAYLYQD
jgi:hypothetical protein